MKAKKNRIKWQNLLLLTLAGVTIFLAPMKLYDSGVTRIKARGGYSGHDRAVLYFVVNRYQIARMRDIVHDLDKTAFITISEVADIFRANEKQN